MPVLETARLRLRPFRLEDAPEQHRLVYSDADVMRYVADGVTRTLEQVERGLRYFNDHDAQHGFSIWAVETLADGLMIGNCGLIHIQQTDAVEVAYAYGKAFWGQGYATEAAQACVQHGFESAQLDEIIGLTYPENTASQKVLRKLGMVYEGIHNQYYNFDLAVYRLKRADFPPRLQ